MNALLPLLAAVFQASALTFDKVILSIRGVTFRGYIGTSFAVSFGIVLAIFLVVRPPLHIGLFADFRWAMVLVSSAIGIGGNLLFYRALDGDRLGEIQTLDLLPHVPVIIVSSIVFSDERNLFVLVPALVASLAILWSHWEHHHLAILRYSLSFLLFSLISAPVAASFSKILLETWHPVTLDLVRSGAMAMVLTPLFSRQLARVTTRAFLFLLVTNALTTVAWLLFFFSYQRSGIVYTLLLFSLQPLLVYLASLIFLKEPFHVKKFIAFGVVLAMIVSAQLLQR